MNKAAFIITTVLYFTMIALVIVGILAENGVI